MSQSCTRLSASLRHLILDKPNSITNSISIISVRWRKPRWVPKSKSKIFYVRKPTPIDKEEKGGLDVSYQHYNTFMKSLRSYVVRTEGLYSSNQSKDFYTAEKSKEFDKMSELTNQFNQKSAALREERLKIEDEAKRSKRARLIEEEKQNLEKMQLESELFIQQNVEESEHFVTRENLDEKIEQLLNSHKDFNFSIDKTGSVENDSRKTEQEISKEQ